MRQELLTQFDGATQALLHLLSSINEEELNTQIFKSKWTAAQIGEHLYKSYAVVDTLNGATKQTLRAPDEKVERIKKLFLDFEIKMGSPEAIIPSNDLIDKKQLLASLEERIAQLKEIIETRNLLATCTDYAIPEYGEFTRLEWLWFDIFHTQRHVYQLNKIIEKFNTKQFTERKSHMQF